MIELLGYNVNVPSRHMVSAHEETWLMRSWRDPQWNVSNYTNYRKVSRATRRYSWLRHCARGRNVGGSISDGDIEIYYSLNTSGRTMTNSNEYPGYFLGSKVDNFSTFMSRLSRNSGNPNFWNPKGLSRTVMGHFTEMHYQKYEK